MLKMHFIFIGKFLLMELALIMSHRDSYNSLFSESGYPILGDIPLLNRKIFRGTRVTIREHPYIVSIRRQYVHYLTGCLLTKNVAVTVAHPLYRVPLNELNVVVGENYSDRGTILLTVLILLIHHEFDPYTLKSDISVIRFYEDVIMRSSSKAIALVSPINSVVGRVFVTGWGRCDFTGRELCLPRSSIYASDELMDPMLRTISFIINAPNNACDVYKQHDNPIQRGMLCVGESRDVNAVTPCLGVPGAALVLRGKLAGLLSWGLGCGYAHDLPLVYTNIQHYVTWLVENISILGDITHLDIKELFVITNSYKLSAWLQKTRENKPLSKLDQLNKLRPLSIDKTLCKLEGKIYDIRDFVYNGKHRTEKKKIYRKLKVHLNATSKNIYHNVTIMKTYPFLSNESLNVNENDYYDSD